MNNSQFSLANRKQLADLLGDAYQGLRYKAQCKYRHNAQELRNKYLLEIAEKRGAMTLVAKIEAANKTITDLKGELASLGFVLDEQSRLDINVIGAKRFAKSVAERITKEIGKADDIDARFDSTQLAMMTVPTLEDARKLLESVTNI